MLGVGIGLGFAVVLFWGLTMREKANRRGEEIKRLEDMLSSTYVHRSLPGRLLTSEWVTDEQLDELVNQLVEERWRQREDKEAQELKELRARNLRVTKELEAKRVSVEAAEARLSAQREGDPMNTPIREVIRDDVMMGWLEGFELETMHQLHLFLNVHRSTLDMGSLLGKLDSDRFNVLVAILDNYTALHATPKESALVAQRKRVRKVRRVIRK